MAAFYEQKWFRSALPYAAGALAAAGAVAGYGASQGWFDSSTAAAPDMSGQNLMHGMDNSGVMAGGGSSPTGAIAQAATVAGTTGADRGMFGQAVDFVGRNPALLLGAGLAASTLLGGDEEEPEGDLNAQIASNRAADQARWDAIPYEDYRNKPRYGRPTTRSPLDPRARGGERRYFAEGGGIEAAMSERLPNGYLSGPGDGLSDSIGAIAHSEDGDARDVDVADGEYVIAADIVSGLGNGSTDAGVRFLDELQQWVRNQRTGGEQPGPLNPRQMMGR